MEAGRTADSDGRPARPPAPLATPARDPRLWDAALRMIRPPRRTARVGSRRVPLWNRRPISDHHGGRDASSAPPPPAARAALCAPNAAPPRASLSSRMRPFERSTRLVRRCAWGRTPAAKPPPTVRKLPVRWCCPRFLCGAARSAPPAPFDALRRPSSPARERRLRRCGRLV